MDPITQTFLIEWLQITIVALALGLGVCAIIRRMRPELSWSNSGNVWTGPIHGGDFVIVSGLFLLFYIGLADAGSVPTDADSGTPEISISHIFSSAVTMLFIAGVTVGAIAIRGTNVNEFYGLNRIKAAKVIAYGLLGAAVAYFLGVVVVQWWNQAVVVPTIGVPKEQSMVTFFKESGSTSARLAVIASACIAAPLAEEFIFRGYIYPVLKRFTEPVFAAIITSVVFAIIHNNLTGIPVLALLSLILVFSYERSGSLWLPISIHAAFNSINIMGMLAD
ncbi:CPBP family intramembrane glutamic endopeptidase [Sulfuriroseicoccus oceanibius]|uniref:CPBP family intramembrane metalloprotease n=1 Tax=Sulfuriroseicoccus oceanibius TaxID=2707525 RepID=A0A6B3LFY7_9BACT|nr:CPBP family intramembrane glutamic endopeptidase [Sulfuriroseicoccus oceanibius]QQL45654.1 CPBP family intramembrane metalloprotease [Sulfuriroseicoccus oceanibius]